MPASTILIVFCPFLWGTGRLATWIFVESLSHDTYRVRVSNLGGLKKVVNLRFSPVAISTPPLHVRVPSGFNCEGGLMKNGMAK